MCSNSDCVRKKLAINQLKSDEILIPLRVMVCAHSICELCLLHSCQQNNSFIKCSICGFNNTITENVSRNVIQSETDIKKWLDSKTCVAQVLRLDINSFPLDLYWVSSGVDSGLITATKTVETIELDLDEECVTSVDTTKLNNSSNSLTEDDITVTSILSKVPKTATKKFHEMVNKGVKAFTDLSTNHTSIKRNSDETKEWFKKIRTNTKETFHRLHSILQLREKELMEEIDNNEEMRLQDLRIFMNEILSKRSELKGKLLHCNQLQSDRDKNGLKKAIEQLVKDSNVLHLNPPQEEYKLLFDSNIESLLRKYGTLERNNNSVNEEMNVKTEDDIQELTYFNGESPISVSSDEDMTEVTNESQIISKVNKEIVTVVQNGNKSPFNFYVQKTSEKERFEYLKCQMNEICSSAYYHAPAIDNETLNKTGEQIFAYSILKKCWSRANLIHYREVENEEIEYLADVFLIDYGITETVNWYNIREKKSELFDQKKWPPFAYNCALYNIKQNRRGSSRDWSQNCLDVFNKYVDNNQLVMFVFQTKDGINFVNLIHYDVPEVTYQIPSIIEILVYYEFAVMIGDIDFNSYNGYKNCKSLKYPESEMPKTLKTVSVLVSHVESPDLFYVQLQRKHDNLLKLIDELNQTYNESNVGIYTYYCPKVGTPCAALFEGDNRFYRALVSQKGKSSTETVVHFIDFGNKQTISNSNLRLLKDHFVTNLAIQSIPCYLIHVEPSYGYKWSPNATDYFKYAISNDRGPQILTMCVYECKQQKLGVLLRSYDGDKGININEQLVKRNLAISSGRLSAPDDENHRLSSSQESLNSLNSPTTARDKASALTLPFTVSAFIVVKEMFERSKLAKADKRSSLIKVSVSSVTNPSKFYVQIDKSELKSYFQELEKALHEEYSSSRYRHLGDTNFINEDLCAFKIEGNWRRGRVIERLNNLIASDAPEEPKFKVFDLDYGDVYELKVSQMRRLSDQFTKDGSFAVMCRLALVRPTGGSDWTHSAIDEFKHAIKQYEKELYILVKENQITEEPFSVKLYGQEITIPGAFEKQKTVYHSINSILIAKGLALFHRNPLPVNNSDCESDDDNEINDETPRETRTQMPFSLFSQSNENVSVLESLHQRQQLNNETNSYAQKVYKYSKEVYPEERTFYGIPTDVDSSAQFCISFRLYKNNGNIQPLQAIEKNITDTIHAKGELAPFSGPFTKGNACTAYFEFDHTWNRAEIEGISQNSNSEQSMLIVRFIDYGNKQTILVDKLSSDVFGIDVPKLALKCQLFNIKPVNEESVKLIKNEIYIKVLDKKCKFFWENYPNIPMIVSVEIPVGNSYEPLRSILIDQRLIINDNIDDNRAQKEVNAVLEKQELLEQTFKPFPVKFKPSKFYRVVMSFPLVENYAFFQADEILKPQRGQSDESEINEQHDQFIWMLTDMRENVDKYKILNNIGDALGMPCCAQFSDECWYRGLVIDIDHEERKSQIFFVDYGNTDIVPFNKVREISKDHITKAAAHAFLCKLYNVRPRERYLWSSREDLVDKMIEHLSELSNENKLLALFKSCDSIPYEIDLYIPTEDRTKPEKHALQEFVDSGILEFIDPKLVWRKPIQTDEIIKTKIKTEVMD